MPGPFRVVGPFCIVMPLDRLAETFLANGLQAPVALGLALGMAWAAGRFVLAWLSDHLPSR